MASQNSHTIRWKCLKICKGKICMGKILGGYNSDSIHTKYGTPPYLHGDQRVQGVIVVIAIETWNFMLAE